MAHSLSLKLEITNKPGKCGRDPEGGSVPPVHRPQFSDLGSYISTPPLPKEACSGGCPTEAEACVYQWPQNVQSLDQCREPMTHLLRTGTLRCVINMATRDVMC